MEASNAQQFVALKQRSSQTQTALDRTYHNLRALEDELADFLDDYYREVGAAFEELSGLQRELDAVGAAQFQLPPRSEGAALDRSMESPSARPVPLREMYRELARDCHPDQGAMLCEDSTAMKAEMMKTLNAAYARRNLSEMWKLKWQLEQQKHAGQLTHRQRLELLTSQQDQMQSALEEMQRREQEIRDSSAYQLFQHARLLRLCGQNFTELVKARVEGQIDETRKALVSTKIKQRYWQHVTMQPSGRPVNS